MGTVEIINIDRLIGKLGRLQNINLTKPMKESCYQLENSAKSKAPVDTGRLKGSIRNEVTESDTYVTGKVFTDVEYARYQEYGTSRVPERRYMRGALADNRNLIKQKFVDHIKSEVRSKI